MKPPAESPPPSPDPRRVLCESARVPEHRGGAARGRWSTGRERAGLPPEDARDRAGGTRAGLGVATAVLAAGGADVVTDHRDPDTETRARRRPRHHRGPDHVVETTIETTDTETETGRGRDRDGHRGSAARRRRLGRPPRRLHSGAHARGPDAPHASHGGRPPRAADRSRTPGPHAQQGYAAPPPGGRASAAAPSC